MGAGPTVATPCHEGDAHPERQSFALDIKISSPPRAASELIRLSVTGFATPRSTPWADRRTSNAWAELQPHIGGSAQLLSKIYAGAGAPVGGASKAAYCRALVAPTKRRGPSLGALAPSATAIRMALGCVGSRVFPASARSGRAKLAWIGPSWKAATQRHTSLLHRRDRPSNLWSPQLDEFVPLAGSRSTNGRAASST